MEKIIRNKENIIRIVTEQGYCSNNVHITKAFFENEELKKILHFQFGMICHLMLIYIMKNYT